MNNVYSMSIPNQSCILSMKSIGWTPSRIYNLALVSCWKSFLITKQDITEWAMVGLFLLLK